MLKKKYGKLFAGMMILVVLGGCNGVKGVEERNDEGQYGEKIVESSSENVDVSQSIQETENDSVITYDEFLTGVYGNTNGNLVNGGLVAKQGDWLYLSGKTGLYKMKLDGSDVQKLCSGYEGGAVHWINVVDDWVYFASIGLYKVRTDGTEFQQIDTEDVRGVHVIGDRIYYGSEYRMYTDGTEKQLLCERRGAAGYTINVVDGWIYFLNKDDNGERAVFKMRVDGSEKKAIYYGRTDYMIVDGEWIYYVNYEDDCLYKMTTEGLNNQLILENEKVSSINVSDEWIYYRGYYDDELSLCKVRIDGTDNQLLCAENAVELHIIDEYIYYRINGDYTLHCIKNDGTDRKILKVDVEK